MAETRRLINLPGYDDTARDIYETPDLTDDTSTTITHPQSPRSPSDTSASSDEENDESYGISRRRLYPERARSRFVTVQTGKHVDLSDRVDGKRRGYKVRRKPQQEETAEDEGLEARIARLRREIEECKVDAESELDFGGRDETSATELEGLSKVLASLDTNDHRRRAGYTDRTRTTPDGRSTSDGAVSEEQVLTRVADFDSRLAALERALGISALDTSTTDSLAMPILPSLLLLDQQMAVLSSAGSLTNLDTASARIQKLKSEAEALTQPQSQSRPTTRGEDEGSQQPSTLAQEDAGKLQSLYQLLPTLQSLSPTVPAVLDRLRSLRSLHANASSAESELDELEKRQRDMDTELKAWKEGLEKVEMAVTDANEANGKNGVFVEAWVKQIEARMRTIER